MRITFLTPPDSFSGGLRVVAVYARELRARGHQVTIVSNARARPGLREQLRALRRGKLAELRQKALPQHGHLGQCGVALRILERARPITAADVPDGDVVVATWWETAVWMHSLPASKGLKVHLVQGYETWGDPLATEKVNAALRLPNLKIAISAGLKRDIEAIVGDLGMKVVPNAVDLGQFDAPARARNRKPRVGYVYARDPIKGADRCHAVIERCRQRLPELEVIAFGSDLPGGGVPLPAGTVYHRRPAQHDLAGIYASCDAWLFATRVDSFGLPLLEAMACRTPVVGLPVGAAPELLVDGAGVLVLPKGDDDLVESLADALGELLVRPEESWLAMSNLAHERAHSYGWGDATCRLETLIQAALESGLARAA